MITIFLRVEGPSVETPQYQLRRYLSDETSPSVPRLLKINNNIFRRECLTEISNDRQTVEMS